MRRLWSFCFIKWLVVVTLLPVSGEEFIRNVRSDANDDGVPDRLGAIVTLSGTVTSPPVFLSPQQILVNFQDPTGGLPLIFRRPLPDRTLLKEGQRLQVVGQLNQFAGACQLLVQRWRPLGIGSRPVPKEILADQVNGEDYEGLLVRVVGTLQVTSEGFVLSDRSGKAVVQMPRRFFRLPWFQWFLEPFLGSPSVSVVGVVWQQDYDPPFREDYVLLPRRPSDISMEREPSYIFFLLLILSATAIVIFLIYAKKRVEKRLQEVRQTARQLDRAQKELQIKRELDRMTHSGGTEQEILSTTAKKLREVLKAALVRITVEVSGKSQTLLDTEEGRDPKKLWSEAQKRLPAEVMESPKGMVTEVASVGRVIAVPLLSGDRVTGRILMTWKEKEKGPRDPEDLQLIDEIGRHLLSCLQQSRLRKQVAEQQKTMEQVFRSLPIGLVFVSADRKVMLSNPAGQEYLRLLGEARAVERGGVLRGPLAQILKEPPRGSQRSQRLVLEEPRYAVFDVEPQVIGNPESPEGWILLIRDVTWEQEVQRRMETQERLAALGQLAAGIAHDFNNLLQSLIGSGELLLMEAPADMPEWATEQLRSIQRQAERTARTIRQLLDFGRQTVPRRQRLDIGHLIDDTLRFLKRTLPENIDLQWKRPEIPVVVYADPGQMEQVLTNLVVNSRDAMPEGGTITVELSVRQFSTDQPPPFSEMDLGLWAVLSVSDTGEGIPPEILPRIFEPFFTTKEPGRGTGLGLSQVYGIVRQHGGFIDVQSRVGEFTRFLIYLPALVEEAEPLEEIPQDVPKGKGEKILVVEDEVRVLQTLELMLRRLGYQVETAGNGLEALAYIDGGGRPDLVLTDMVMPQMGGLRLVSELRRRHFPGKVIVMSGYPLQEAIHRLQQSGVSDWIAKPFHYADLAVLLRKVLDRP
ncbi:MAG: ATP-binding protein [Armatimonadetes bacterium]|nr:ATP-binding protein [Armatimonadota bacterium]MDW8122565.1 ATP-binding protein [Armatimonadota bacterium]